MKIIIKKLIIEHAITLPIFSYLCVFSERSLILIPGTFAKRIKTIVALLNTLITLLTCFGRVRVHFLHLFQLMTEYGWNHARVVFLGPPGHYLKLFGNVL